MQKLQRCSCDTYVSAIIAILRITSGRNGDIVRDTLVQRVDGPERIDVYQEIREGSVRARLEGCCITPRTRVERVYRSEERVRILSRAPAAGVGGYVPVRIPVRLFMT